jgi:hypothetical protein
MHVTDGVQAASLLPASMEMTGAPPLPGAAAPAVPVDPPGPVAPPALAPAVEPAAPGVAVGDVTFAQAADAATAAARTT